MSATGAAPAGRFRVRATPCDTCIYSPGIPRRDQDRLEAEIADPHMPGRFASFRACHHHRDNDQVCCRGFWNRHRDKFQLGQLAQRLDLIHYTDEGDTDPAEILRRRDNA